MAEHKSEQGNSLEQSLKSQAETEPILLPSNATVYANNLGIGMTVFDIMVTFGEVIGVKNGQAVIQQRIKVVMSPLLAKIAARSLVASVAEYEKRFGTIKEPEGAGEVVEKSVPVRL